MSAPVVPKLYLVLLLNSFLPVICSLALASPENGDLPFHHPVHTGRSEKPPSSGHATADTRSKQRLLCGALWWPLYLKPCVLCVLHLSGCSLYRGGTGGYLLNPVHLQVLGNGHFYLFVFIWFGLFSTHSILLASFIVTGAVGLLTKVPSPF